MPMKVSENTFPIIQYCKLPPPSVCCHKLQCIDIGTVSGFDSICMHAYIHIHVHIVHNTTFKCINQMSNILSHMLTNIPFLSVYLVKIFKYKISTLSYSSKAPIFLGEETNNKYSKCITRHSFPILP